MNVSELLLYLCTGQLVSG